MTEVSALAEAVDVILRDGHMLRWRPPRREDADSLLELLRSLSERSFYLRFHGFRHVDAAPGGNIFFWSQSGALGLALLEAAESRGIGLSSFVSIGNKADVSSNDLLEWWEDDPATRLVLLDVESFGNPRRFGRLAQRIARRIADPRFEERDEACWPLDSAIRSFPQPMPGL